MTENQTDKGQRARGTVPTTQNEPEGQSTPGTVPGSPSDGTNGPGAAHQGEDATHTRDLQEQLAAAEAKADEHLDDLRRLAADFDNYRKRVTRDQELTAARATERLVKHLLPILDDLERALEAAEQHEEAKLEEGVALVHRSLADLSAARASRRSRRTGASTRTSMRRCSRSRRTRRREASSRSPRRATGWAIASYGPPA